MSFSPKTRHSKTENATLNANERQRHVIGQHGKTGYFAGVSSSRAGKPKPVSKQLLFLQRCNKLIQYSLLLLHRPLYLRLLAHQEQPTVAAIPAIAVIEGCRLAFNDGWQWGVLPSESFVSSKNRFSLQLLQLHFSTHVISIILFLDTQTFQNIF